MIKMSMWSGYYYKLSPEDAVREFKKHGFMCSELCHEHGAVILNRGNPVEEGKKFKEFLQKENFTMTQGHLDINLFICQPGHLEELCHWIDLYEAIGIKNGVLHLDAFRGVEGMTYDEKTEENYKALKVLDKYMEGKDFKICIENASYMQNMRALVKLIDRLNSKHFAICYDTGHLNVKKSEFPIDPAEFIHLAGNKIQAMHLADNEGFSDQHIMPFGRGTVDFVAVFKALFEIGYDGLLNFEIPGESLRCPPELLGPKLDYIKKVFDYIVEQSKIN